MPKVAYGVQYKSIDADGLINRLRYGAGSKLHTRKWKGPVRETPPLYRSFLLARGWHNGRMINFPRVLIDAIQLDMEKRKPNEACGIITMNYCLNDTIWTLVPMENFLCSPTEFSFNPEQQIKVWNWMENQCETLVAIYHTHPNGTHMPSHRDRLVPQPYDCLYLIVGSDGKIGAYGRGEDGTLGVTVHLEHQEPDPHDWFFEALGTR